MSNGETILMQRRDVLKLVATPLFQREPSGSVDDQERGLAARVTRLELEMTRVLRATECVRAQQAIIDLLQGRS